MTQDELQQLRAEVADLRLTVENLKTLGQLFEQALRDERRERIAGDCRLATDRHTADWARSFSSRNGWST